MEYRLLDLAECAERPNILEAGITPSKFPLWLCPATRLQASRPLIRSFCIDGKCTLRMDIIESAEPRGSLQAFSIRVCFEIQRTKSDEHVNRYGSSWKGAQITISVGNSASSSLMACRVIVLERVEPQIVCSVINQRTRIA